MDRIICVVGPTASGKTKLAVQLAKAYDGEVVSCDSMQIYKHMDIGTAKPTPEEMEGVPHHMIDCVEPGEDFSVGKYVQLADGCVQDILSRGKTAVIAGGTGLYVDSLIAGRTFAPVPQTGKREALEAAAEAEAAEAAQASYYNAGYTPSYASAASYANGSGLTRSAGVNNYNGRRETYYSSNVLYHYRTGEWTQDSEGFWRDSDGYYVVAAGDMAQGSTFTGSKGDCKVYDSGCAAGTTDYYTGW